MKILLAYKPTRETEDIEKTYLPGGLLSIGALLKEQGHDIIVKNFSFTDWSEIREFIEREKPDIVGSTMYTFNRFEVFKLADLVKRIDYNTKFVIGGEFPTVLAEKVLNYSQDIDVIVTYEGEETMVEIVSALKTPSLEKLKNIKGIVFRENNDCLFGESKNENIIYTGQRSPIKDLDTLPLASKYFKYCNIMTARGCPGQCTFCSTPSYWGSNVRLRSVKSMVDEIELLYKKGVKELVISDDTFTFDKQRVIDFCKELIKRNIKIAWDCRSRVNFVDKERLEWMKKAGCYKIGYGIESGSDTVLKNFKKNITKEQILKAGKLTREVGLYMYLFLIIGGPGETDETIRETLEVINELKPQQILTCFLHTYPGTELYKQCQEQGILTDDIWFDSLEHLPQKCIYKYSEDPQKMNDWLKTVHNFFLQNKQSYKSTEQELKNNIEKYNDVYSLNELAVIYAKNKDYDKAIELLNKAVKENDGYYNTYLNLGIVFEKLGDEGDKEKYSEAVDFLKKACEINFKNPVAHKNLGNIYVKLEQYDNAIESYENAVKFNHRKRADIYTMVEELRNFMISSADKIYYQ